MNTTGFLDLGVCESADLGLSVGAVVISLCFFLYLSHLDNNQMGRMGLLAYPFFVIITNHAYIWATRTYGDMLPVHVDWLRFIPVVVSAAVLGISYRFLIVVQFVVYTGGLLFALWSFTGLLYVGIAALGGVLLTAFSYAPPVRDTGALVLLYVLLFATSIILACAIATPDARTCGFPRNKLVLCNDACPVITVEGVYDWTVIITVAAVIIVVKLWALCCKRQCKKSPAAVTAAQMERWEETRGRRSRAAMWHQVPDSELYGQSRCRH
jgi:hypothetical protein